MESEILSGKARYHTHIIDSLNLRGDTGPLRKFLNDGGNVKDLGTSGKYIYCSRHVVSDLALVKLLFERGATLERELSFFLHTRSMSDEVFEWALENDFDKFETEYPVLYEVTCNAGRFKRLVERGADIHAVFDELTPKSLVMALAGAGFIDQVELIVARGADINAVWRDDWIPLFEALLSSHCKADGIERLVKLGADYRYKRQTGHTAIMIAASGIFPSECVLVNKLGYLMSLYQGWADEVDEDGNSALHLAAGTPDGGDVISLLLEKGFDPMLANKEGMTPIEICLSSNKPVLFVPFWKMIQNDPGRFAGLDLQALCDKYSADMIKEMIENTR
jgi:hypothetical protein